MFSRPYGYILIFIDIFSKYARVIPLKDKKGTSIVNAFEMYSINNEGKSVVVERFC